MRRRARHRLIGATVLIAAGVIGFPLLFDTEPRPVAVDIPIELPEKDNVPPLAPPVQSAERAPSPEAATSAATSVATAAVTAPAAGPPLPTPAPAPATKTAVPERKAEPPVRIEAPEKPAHAERSPEKPVERPADKKDGRARDSGKAGPEAVAAKPESRPPVTPSRDQLRIAKAEEGARARALLQGKSEKEAAAVAAAVGRRYIVQVGAFSEAERARAARQKVERTGLKTYTQETKTGAETWIRVRVGPFATRAEADEAAARIKGSGLPASILTM